MESLAYQTVVCPLLGRPMGSDVDDAATSGKLALLLDPRMRAANDVRVTIAERSGQERLLRRRFPQMIPPS